MKIAAITLLLGLAAPAALIGCSDTADEVSDEVTNTISCHSVCERYADCFAPEYDIDGCTDRCEDDADAAEAQETRLEACDSCIDDKSCVESFGCAAECQGIVP